VVADRVTAVARDRQKITGGTTMSEEQPTIAPGVCQPWEEKKKEFPQIQGDEELVKRIWEEIDGLAHTYAWQCLVSF
jgi:hypothetical protein